MYGRGKSSFVRNRKEKITRGARYTLAQQLNGQFNNMHVSGGNNSPPSTPPKTP